MQLKMQVLLSKATVKKKKKKYIILISNLLFPLSAECHLLTL